MGPSPAGFSALAAKAQAIISMEVTTRRPICTKLVLPALQLDELIPPHKCTADLFAASYVQAPDLFSGRRTRARRRRDSKGSRVKAASRRKRAIATFGIEQPKDDLCPETTLIAEK